MHADQVKLTVLDTLIRSFNQDITRDLAWAIFAPPLLINTDIQAFRPELTESRRQWLTNLDAQPQAIKPDYRLGRYYESLWKYFFQHDEQYQWIAQNIIIERQGVTLGELDFIVLDRHSGRFLHIEVAVKFYLFHELPKASTRSGTNNLTINDNRQWLGPNSQDNLEKKWQHLTHHQCPLSSTEESIKVLRKMNIDCSRLDQALCLKGYVFSPGDYTKYPAHFNIENSLHTYLTAEEFKNTAPEKHFTAIIPKQCWLTQTHEKCRINTASMHEMIQHVMQANAPIMIAELLDNKNTWIEKKRFFVTPPSWPSKKRADKTYKAL